LHQRRRPPLHPRDLHADPARAGRRRHVRLRRADHADELPPLPGAGARTHPAVGDPLLGRARAPELRAHPPPLPAAVGGDPGRPVRGPAPAGPHDLGAMEVDGWSFDGFGMGGALEKENLGTIVGWVTDELPEQRPRHLLGISEVDDLFVAIAAGADTFDCVSPSRVARNSAVYTRTGRV